MSFFLVLSTAGSEEEGQRIGKTLVKKRLAACVNIIPGITSHFYWGRKLCTEREVILLIKTVKRELQEIACNIKEIHSYSVPEILFIKIEGGNKKYLDWVQGMMGKRRQRGDKKDKKVIDKRY